MKRRSAASRAFVVLLALFQLGAPPLASIADAALFRSGLSWRAAQHVEGERSSSCPELHHDRCALCPVVTGTFARIEHTPLIPSAQNATHRFPQPLVGLRGSDIIGSHAARAPPA